MFGSGKKKSTKVQTVIGANCTFTGNLVFDGGLHVDGKVVGNVSAEPGSGAVAVISENGCVEGQVRVPHLLLNGSVVGDVYASERVELLRQARVTGDVYYNLLEMAMGAEINGNLLHRKPEEQRLLEHRDVPGEDASKAAPMVSGRGGRAAGIPPEVDLEEVAGGPLGPAKN